LDDILQSGINVNKNLWFECLQKEGFVEVPKPNKKQQQPYIGGKGKKETISNGPKRAKHTSDNSKLYPKLYNLAMQVMKVAHLMEFRHFPACPT
jgi:hypothetical protein